jgi:hypothetical protein
MFGGLQYTAASTAAIPLLLDPEALDEPVVDVPELVPVPPVFVPVPVPVPLVPVVVPDDPTWFWGLLAHAAKRPSRRVEAGVASRETKRGMRTSIQSGEGRRGSLSTHARRMATKKPKYGRFGPKEHGSYDTDVMDSGVDEGRGAGGLVGRIREP